MDTRRFPNNIRAYNVLNLGLCQIQFPEALLKIKFCIAYQSFVMTFRVDDMHKQEWQLFFLNLY